MLLACGLVVLGGCGEEDFKNKPRPAASIDLTGVIQPKGVTVDPAKVGSGPILITISNQTKEPHTVTLTGASVQETVGPIQPLDTGTIQKTLQPGLYQVKAGSERAVAKQIPSGELRVGGARPSSADKLLLP
jgi:uncharacterized ParB-like nuclease family protein